MDIVGLIIQLIAGAIGGNAAGKASNKFNLGTGGNSIAGAVGGLGGRDFYVSHASISISAPRRRRRPDNARASGSAPLRHRSD